MDIREEIKNLIQNALKSVGIEDVDFVVEHPSDLKMGDYSTNVGIKHQDKKEELLRYIVVNQPDEIERVELAGPGFINFHLSKEFFAKSLEEIIEKGGKFGENENLKGQTILMEYTSPNLFKPLHIGNLVGNISGESIARILEYSNADVKRINYPSDIGLTVAKGVWGLTQTKGDPDDIKALGEAYRLGNESYENDQKAKAEIEEINKALYAGSNPEWNSLRESGIETSRKHLDLICEKLGTVFDKEFFESQASPIGKKIVEENKENIFEASEGATVFHGEHTRVFLTSKGLPTYEAKELGLFKLKSDQYPNFNISITITGTEQRDYFKVVLEAIKKVFPSETEGKVLRHITNSFLKLSTGKMSSRKGNVVTGEDLIKEVTEKVKGNGQVAIGAIKYMILRQAIGGDIVFDIEKSVSTEGDSGVYLQYAYARTSSIIAKSPDRSLTLTPDGGLTSVRETREVERLLYRFPEVVERAGSEYAPHYITTYLTELASSFNNFYAHEQVLDDSPETPYKLAIVKAFNIVMKNGLNILAIPAPERM
jgi:arginyl-tRNA synthetase